MAGVDAETRTGTGSGAVAAENASAAGNRPPLRVNFIGLGAIGLPMALRVQAAGHSLVGMDLAASARAGATAHNIDAVGDVAALPPADIVIVMVATPDQLQALVDAALANAATVHGCWVVMSTVGPASIRTQGERLRHAGARVVDAPVTGGVAGARTGQLVIFGAGSGADIDTARPVLETMGQLRLTGEHLGDGQAIKVVNQHLCSVHLVAAAEALNLARSLGLDPGQVLELVEQGAGGSWMLSDRGPRMLAGTDVEVTSAVDIFVKDSTLVGEAAGSCGAEVPLLEVARHRFRAAADAGLGQRDDSRVIETWQGSPGPVPSAPESRHRAPIPIRR